MQSHSALKRSAIAVVALAATFLVIKSFVWSNHAARLIEFGGRDLASAEPEAVLKNSTADELDRLDAATARALNAMPTESSLLVVPALTAVAREDMSRAGDLMEASLGFDPRTRLARSWLFAQAVQDQDGRAAAREGARLIDLTPSRRAELARAIVPYIKGADVRAELRQTPMSPETRGAIVNAAYRDGITADELVEMLPAEALTPDAPDEAGPRVLRSLLQREGRHQELLRRWSARFGEELLAEARGVYDGSFVGKPGGAPFNWTLRSTQAGRAKQLSDLRGAPQATGLEVTQLGFDAVTFAEQAMLLSPGNYSLEFQYRSEADRDIRDRPVRIQVQCSAGRQMLSDIGLKSQENSWSKVVTNFSVPQGCSVQKLQIVGLGRTTNSWQRAIITDLQISPAMARGKERSDAD